MASNEHNGPNMQLGSAYFKDLGRPVEGAWLHSFEAAFEEVTRNQTIRLKARIAPGVLYVLGSEIEKAFIRGDISNTDRTTTQVVDSLIEGATFDEEVARGGLGVNLLTIETKPLSRDSSIKRLRARVSDVARVGGAGYVIRDEKASVSEKIQIERGDYEHFSADSNARHRIAMGNITDPEGIVTPNFLKRLRASLDRHVMLGPVGEIIN